MRFLAYFKLYRPHFGAGWYIALAVFGIIETLLVMRLSRGKNRGKALFFAVGIEYIAFMLVFTVLSRETAQEYRVISDWFWSYRKALSGNRRYFWEIIFNIALYVPLGIWLCAFMKGTRAFMRAVSFSALTELIQLVMKKGYFEFDDIVSNAIGALVGCAVYLILRKVCGSKKALRQ